MKEFNDIEEYENYITKSKFIDDDTDINYLA